ncbi:hypothetical protein ES705_46768 [subsurface metagenome]
MQKHEARKLEDVCRHGQQQGQAEEGGKNNAGSQFVDLTPAKFIFALFINPVAVFPVGCRLFKSGAVAQFFDDFSKFILIC